MVTRQPFLSGLQPQESLWERPAHLLCLITWQGCISQTPLQLSWGHRNSPGQWHVDSSDIIFFSSKALKSSVSSIASFPATGHFPSLPGNESVLIGPPREDSCPLSHTTYTKIYIYKENTKMLRSGRVFACLFLLFCFVFNHSIPDTTKIQLLFAIRFLPERVSFPLPSFQCPGRACPTSGFLAGTLHEVWDCLTPGRSQASTAASTGRILRQEGVVA